MDILTIIPNNESVKFDVEKIKGLYHYLDTASAKRLMNRGVDELALRLKHIEDAADANDRQKAIKLLKTFPGIADQIGLCTLAGVARDVIKCHANGDQIAFAATLARVIRLGNQSLSAFSDMDMRDIKI